MSNVTEDFAREVAAAYLEATGYKNLLGNVERNLKELAPFVFDWLKRRGIDV
jgi:hypothetical protein